MAVVTSAPPVAPETNPAAAPAKKEAVSKETFLQLLVAQIKYQNPLDPADGTQFIAQLAQFSELEQMVGMRTEIEALRKDMEAQNNTHETVGEKNV